ncbi:uncharacterized protein LOC142232866 [Haematobia irritans]|uniref:uncharacterized protein LOC142232866 n=1 Tax=Haematobia irritans TaxID=7368 RepID=UPI003F4FE845
MDSLKAVGDLKLSGNQKKNWKIFKEDFEDFIVARNVKLSEASKLALLRNQIGPDGKEIIRNLELSDEDRKSYEKVINALDNLFGSHTNILYERFVFYNRNQMEHEPVESFIKEIRELASSCEFSNVCEMVRDRIVLGVSDKKLQEKLLKMENITMEQATLECKIFEKQKEQVRAVQETKKIVDEVKEHSGITDNNDDACIDKLYTKAPGKDSTTKYRTNRQCNKCFKIHRKDNCPAFGKKCHKCKKLNHFSVACKSRAVKVNTLSYGEEDSDTNSEFALTYSIKSGSKKDVWMHEVMVLNTPVKFKLDTGSDANIIPFYILRQIIKNPSLKPTKTMLTSYSGHKICPIGEIVLPCVAKDNLREELFLIVKDGYRPILGRDSCVNLGLIKRIWNMEKTE